MPRLETSTLDASASLQETAREAPARKGSAPEATAPESVENPALEAALEQLRPRDISPARTFRERASAIGAFFMLLFVDGVMKLAGFHRFYRMLRTWPTVGHPPEDPDAIRRICTAVDRASTYYFKRAWCLQRSATAVCLLRLRGLAAELTIGVQKIPFAAHAWAELDGRVVNDHPEVRKRFFVIERC